MKFSIRKPKLPKINLPRIDLSFIKTEWAMIGIGIIICLVIAFLLIKMLSGKDAALLEYRRLLEEFEDTANDLPELPDTTLPSLSIQSDTGEIKASLSYLLANTDELRVVGLSDHETLEVNTGMLFTFDSMVDGSFTMEGMKFPLDIMFLDSNMIVVEVATALQPCEVDCTPYTPTVLYQYAVEVNAGVIESLGIIPGDLVSIQ